jgi:hypothetical protein
VSAHDETRTAHSRLAGGTLRRLNALAWFGVLGGSIAWALQFLLSMQFGLARCESPDGRFPLPVHAVAIALGTLGVVVGVLAEMAAWTVFRATHDDEQARSGPAVSGGRLRFLGAVGLTVNPLTVTICAMTAIGVPLLSICHQS